MAVTGFVITFAPDRLHEYALDDTGAIALPTVAGRGLVVQMHPIERHAAFANDAEARSIIHDWACAAFDSAPDRA